MTRHPRDHRALGAPDERLGYVPALDLPGLAERIEERGGSLPESDRLGKRVDLLRGHRCLDRERQRPGWLAGPVPVARDLDRGNRSIARREPALECGSERSVQRHPLGGEELGVDDLQEKCVAERGDDALRCLKSHEDPARQRLAKCRRDVPWRALERVREQPIVDPPSRRGRRAEHVTGAGREAGDTRREQVAQHRRDGRARAAGAGCAARSLGEDQLLDVERVPIGPRQQSIDDAGRRGLVEEARRLLGDLVAVEPGELDPIDMVLAFELGEEGQVADGFPSLVGPRGQEQEHRIVAKRSGQEPNQVTRRALGPLDVLDDEHEQALPGEPLEDPEEQLEEPRLDVRSGSRAAFRSAERLASSGRSRVSSARPGPRIAGRRSFPVSRTSDRSISTNGAYGRASSATSRHAPSRTLAPGAASAANFAISRLFADPGLTADHHRPTDALFDGRQRLPKARESSSPADERSTPQHVRHGAGIIRGSPGGPTAIGASRPGQETRSGGRREPGERQMLPDPGASAADQGPRGALGLPDGRRDLGAAVAGGRHRGAALGARELRQQQRDCGRQL